MKKYFVLPYFQLYKMKFEGRYFHSCKNRGLIYAIALIGFYKAPYEKKSVYKRGIDYICDAYWKRYHEKLTKTEVRRLLRPEHKKKHSFRIPKRTLEILEIISSCIDFPEEDIPHLECMAMKGDFCKKKQRPFLHCYYYLVFDLITQLRALEGKMDPNSGVYHIYMQIINHPKECGK